MTDEALARAIATAATLHGKFRLRSGRIADIYFDKYRFESEPALLRRVARAMCALIPPDAELLAGLELGGVPIATAMSLETGMPAVFVRKRAKDYGTCLAVEAGTCAAGGCCWSRMSSPPAARWLMRWPRCGRPART